MTFVGISRTSWEFCVFVENCVSASWTRLEIWITYSALSVVTSGFLFWGNAAKRMLGFIYSILSQHCLASSNYILKLCRLVERIPLLSYNSPNKQTWICLTFRGCFWEAWGGFRRHLWREFGQVVGTFSGDCLGGFRVVLGKVSGRFSAAKKWNKPINIPFGAGRLWPTGWQPDRIGIHFFIFNMLMSGKPLQFQANHLGIYPRGDFGMPGPNLRSTSLTFFTQRTKSGR